MGTEIGKAVADAGPIIHLREIGILRFLRLFDPLHVPDAVWEETVGVGRVSGERLDDLENIRYRSLNAAEIQSLVEQEDLGHLQKGECECLLLLVSQDLDLVLTDDLAVRDAVKELGGTPVGSLGIIVRACREGRIGVEEAERLLRRLHAESTLFVTAALVERAIDQLRAHL